MIKPTWERLLLCGALLLVVSSARADDEVVHRLTKFGKVSSGDANRIAHAVSGRMKRAADMTSNSDPLRMAVSNALYNTPVSQDAMAAAKIRLRLYAGLNEWALENLFAARAGSMATCTTQFGLSKRDCQALLAAGGRVTLAEASKLGAGAPLVPVAQPAFAQTGAQTGAQPSRFGGYNSGFTAQAPRYGAQPAAYVAPARPAAYAAPAARPMRQPVAAVQMAPAAPPPPSAASIAERKAEYARQREAYLERKKQEMAARKAKVVETAGGTQRIARGPGTADEAAVMGVAPSAGAKAAAAAPAKVAKTDSVDDAPVASADEAAPAEKPALDNGFLDETPGRPARQEVSARRPCRDIANKTVSLRCLPLSLRHQHPVVEVEHDVRVVALLAVSLDLERDRLACGIGVLDAHQAQAQRADVAATFGRRACPAPRCTRRSCRPRTWGCCARRR